MSGRLMITASVISAFAVLLVLRPSVSLAADTEGVIDVCTPDAVCVVDGDFMKTFKPGDPVWVSRYKKPFASGVVVEVSETFMLVRVEKKTPDYFIGPGDRVHPPIPPERKRLKTLRTTLDKEDVEAANKAAEEGAAAEKAGETQKNKESLVDKTSGEEAGSSGKEGAEESKEKNIMEEEPKHESKRRKKARTQE